MKKIILSGILWILTVIACNAQDYVFRVMASKGVVETRKNGSTSRLKIGSKIAMEDDVIVGSGAYLGLVHQNGKTIELRTPGTYRARDLTARAVGASESVSRRYLSYLMNKIDRAGDPTRNYKSNMSGAGAVERATIASDIKVMIKETKNANRVYGNQVWINWNEVTGTSSYLISIKNIFDEVLLRFRTSSTQLLLDFTRNEIARERFVIVSIRSENSPDLPPKDFGIQRILPQQVNEFTAQLERLKSELGEESAINSLVLASFFEENKLFMDAQTEYMNAIELSPEVADYQLLYNEFILTNDLGK